MEIRIYIADLNAYNNGILKGEWVTLPTDEEELREVVARHSNNFQYDWAIHDYEAPFEIGEYDDVFKLNKLAEELADIAEDEAVIEAVMSNFCTVQEGLDVLINGEYRVYYDCDDMGDVACQFIEETGMLHDVPDYVQAYFDFDKFGRDMELGGTFIKGRDAKHIPFYVEIFN